MRGLRALLACAALVPAAWAGTQVRIRLSGEAGSENKLPLGLPPFTAERQGEAAPAAAADLRGAIRDDLLFSRYFSLLEEGPSDAKDKAWKGAGASWVLAAKVSQPGGKVTVSARLVDVSSGETVFERYYRQDARFSRALAHRVADDVVKALTGKDGVAHTQIAFANNSSGHKEIHVVDFDGSNIRQVTRDRSIALLPRFSPDRKLLAYTSYKNGNPDLYLVDLEKGKASILSEEQGLNLAGGFSPDGAALLLTLSRGSSPNLFVKLLSDGTLTRLTRHYGADSSPTYSPDGKEVAFVSDRSGNPQIHLLDVDTQRARRLTSLNWCDSPAWSPTGEWIAFSGRLHHKDKMDIFLVDITGNQLRQLTKGEGSNEDPSWSPDGRFLAFSSTRGGRAEIYVMDADGSAPHRLAQIPGESSTPSWSR